MQIVIEIDEDYYEIIKEWFDSGVGLGTGSTAIAKGTPLPKNHGRLIDADALNFNADYNEPLIHKQDVDNAPTIIEEVGVDDE